jgi:type VI secretion system secreted protein Hcp
MPVARSQPTPQGAGACDAYLHVQTKRAGKLKGECNTPGHQDDIAVSGWQWGLKSASAVDSNQATARRSYSAFTVTKSIDLATTPLMSALATNDEVKEARLVLRRAGGDQEDFFVITLKSARIVALEHQFDEAGQAHETVSFTFTEVQVEYTPQRGTGLRSGSTTFTDTIAPAA